MKSGFSTAVVVLVTSSLLSAGTSDVSDLTRDLKADKPNVRAHAAAELAQRGPEAAAAVPALIDALKDESLAVRSEVLIALERIGPAAREAVPALIGVLKEKDSHVTLGAIGALGAIGHDAADAAPLLSDYLADKDARHPVSAAFALARILPGDAKELKPAIPVLVNAVQSKHRAVRDEALRGLMLIGASAVPELSRLVSNYEKDPQSAAAASSVLQMLGARSAPATPELIRALASRQELVVTRAADALGAIGPAAHDAVPALQKLLQNDHPLTRTHAAHSLGMLGPDAEAAVSDLTKALKDKELNVRREAADGLGKIGPAAKPAVPDLIAALNDVQPVAMQSASALARIGAGAVPNLTDLIKDKRLGRWAVVILGETGTAAAPAVSSLRAALKTADDNFARDIILTLGRIGPDAAEAAPELIEFLQNKDHDLRIPAAFALGNIRALQAVPALKDLIQDDDDMSSLPLVAAGALVLIEGPEGKLYGANVKLALPRLITALSDKSTSIRREAAIAIRQIGPHAASAVPALARGLQDPDPGICIDCLWALTAILPEESAATLVPDVVSLLSSPDAHVRYTACYAAGSIGPAAADAVPILEKNLQGPDAHLQITSAWALVRIRPENAEVAEECVDPLVRGLSSRDSQVRSEAAASLELLGPSAQRAVPVLTELTHDDDQDVRAAALKALQKIQPAAKAPGTSSRSKSSSGTRKKAL